jgi:sugar phosphate isomerase/epimerase
MSIELGAFSLCEPDFEQFLESSAAAGFRHVALYELPYKLETLDAAQAARIAASLKANGLTAIAAGGSSNVLTPDGVATFKRKLDGAAKFGASLFDTGSLGSGGNKSAQVIEEETGRFCDGMAQAGEHAATMGITICLETHGGMTGTVPSCLKLMRRLDHPNVQIGYDPANIRYYEGASPLDQLDRLTPLIGHVHVKDHVGVKGTENFPTVGKGELAYPEIIATLITSDYEGYISVERAPGETVEQRAQELIRQR